MQKIDLTTRFSRIKGIALDMDGVLTDGTLILMPDGDQVRTMNIRDGFAMHYAIEAGYHLTVISAGSISPGVEARLKRLGMHDFRLGVTNKIEAFEDFLNSYHLTPEEVLYAGDDMPDYECMVRTGLAACPSDAADEIRTISHYVSALKGGHGFVRELIEKVLHAQNKHWSLNL